MSGSTAQDQWGEIVRPSSWWKWKQLEERGSQHRLEVKQLPSCTLFLARCLMRGRGILTLAGPSISMME